MDLSMIKAGGGRMSGFSFVLFFFFVFLKH